MSGFGLARTTAGVPRTDILDEEARPAVANALGADAITMAVSEWQRRTQLVVRNVRAKNAIIRLTMWLQESPEDLEDAIPSSRLVYTARTRRPDVGHHA